MELTLFPTYSTSPRVFPLSTQEELQGSALLFDHLLSGSAHLGEYASVLALPGIQESRVGRHWLGREWEWEHDWGGIKNWHHFLLEMEVAPLDHLEFVIVSIVENI